MMEGRGTPPVLAISAMPVRHHGTRVSMVIIAEEPYIMTADPAKGASEVNTIRIGLRLKDAR